MNKVLLLLVTLAMLGCSTRNNLTKSEPEKALKVILVSGGGSHDYVNQKNILMAGIKQRANVEFKVIGDNPAQIKQQLSKPGWADGYD
ncbi:MAG: hypothetical protein HRT88_22365, partial [Lentisphaeraceae bacterium]|nr:hypothetical protein [Lentisphaeraceae bacterium]